MLFMLRILLSLAARKRDVNNFEKTLLLVENSNSLKATMQSGKQSYPILSLSKPKSLNPNHVLKHNAKIQLGSVLHSSIRADSHSHVLQCL
jgi:membrane-bound lytic murein transglycosylase MltF